MRLLDPTAHQHCDYSELKTLSSVASYTPAQSGRTGKWFALHMVTGTAYALDDLDEDVRSAVQGRIAAYELTQKLMEALQWVQEGLLDGHSTDHVRALAREEVARNYGETAINAAFSVARYEGYEMRAIEHALACLDQEPDMEKLLEGVDVTNISELVE